MIDELNRAIRENAEAGALAESGAPTWRSTANTAPAHTGNLRRDLGTLVSASGPLDAPPRRDREASVELDRATERRWQTASMDDLLAGVAGGAAGGGIAGRIIRRRTAKNRAAGVLECALRDRSGRTSRLLKRWRHGRATFERGVITFEPFVALGLRIRRPFTQAIQLRVISVADEIRDSTKSEAWLFRGTVRAIHTEESEVEWGISHLDEGEWAIALVTGPS